MVQIETAEGLENIDEICQVDGVGESCILCKRDEADSPSQDLILIGPNDLALALLGYCSAKQTETIFLEAIDTIVETARRHGKKTGIVVLDGESAKKAKQRFDFVVLSADVRALQAWYGRELNLAMS